MMRCWLAYSKDRPTVNNLQRSLVALNNALDVATSKVQLTAPTWPYHYLPAEQRAADADVAAIQKGAYVYDGDQPTTSINQTYVATLL